MATCSHTVDDWPLSLPQIRPSSRRVHSSSTAGCRPTADTDGACIVAVAAATRVAVSPSWVDARRTSSAQRSSHSLADRVASSGVAAANDSQKVAVCAPVPTVKAGAESSSAQSSTSRQASLRAASAQGADPKRTAGAGAMNGSGAVTRPVDAATHIACENQGSLWESEHAVGAPSCISPLYNWQPRLVRGGVSKARV